MPWEPTSAPDRHTAHRGRVGWTPPRGPRLSTIRLPRNPPRGTRTPRPARLAPHAVAHAMRDRAARPRHWPPHGARPGTGRTPPTPTAWGRSPGATPALRHGLPPPWRNGGSVPASPQTVPRRTPRAGPALAVGARLPRGGEFARDGGTSSRVGCGFPVWRDPLPGGARSPDRGWVLWVLLPRPGRPTYNCQRAGKRLKKHSGMIATL